MTDSPRLARHTRPISGVSVAQVAAFLDEYLEIDGFPDYPHALNGLQVEAAGPVKRVAFAVDARERTIRRAADWADMLVVHHGLFWGGLQPLVGPHFRRVSALVRGGLALYSAHLPLDAHPEVGNSAVLARQLALDSLAPFGDYRGRAIGWKGLVTQPDSPGDEGPREDAGLTLSALADRLGGLTRTGVQVLPGGPGRVRSVGVVTGAGASLLAQAADEALDVLVTGEAQHHHAIEAAELGVSVLLAGHYETETWGVRALADLLKSRYGVDTRFIDLPTGL